MSPDGYRFCAPAGSRADEGGRSESRDPGGRERVEASAAGTDVLDDSKTKVLQVLSKLQDEAPQRRRSNRGCSNFDDCKSAAGFRTSSD